MKFSIILPTISINNTLLLALDSLVNQKYTGKYEIIVIIDNNNSAIKDGLCVLYKNEIKNNLIKLIQNKTNLGLTKSLNKAICSAKGEFIIRNDEDDISFLCRLAEIAKVLKKNNKIKFISSNFLYQYTKKKYIKKKINFSSSLSWKLKFKNPIAHSSVCFEKNLFLTLGMYNETLKVSQDYDLWCRIISKNNNCHYHINKCLVNIRINEESISKQNSITQRLNSILIALKFNYPKHFNYRDYCDPKRIIFNIQKLEDNRFYLVKNKLNALIFCYLFNPSEKQDLQFSSFNINILINILFIYFNYPNLLVKKLFNY